MLHMHMASARGKSQRHLGTFRSGRTPMASWGLSLSTTSSLCTKSVQDSVKAGPALRSSVSRKNSPVITRGRCPPPLPFVDPQEGRFLPRRAPVSAWAQIEKQIIAAVTKLGPLTQARAKLPASSNELPASTMFLPSEPTLTKEFLESHFNQQGGTCPVQPELHSYVIFLRSLNSQGASILTSQNTGSGANHTSRI